MNSAQVFEGGFDRVGALLAGSSLDKTMTQVEIGVVVVMAIICVIEIFVLVMMAIGIVFGVYLRIKAFKSSSTPQVATVRSVVEA